MNKIVSHGACAAIGLLLGIGLTLPAHQPGAQRPSGPVRIETMPPGSQGQTMEAFAATIDKWDPDTPQRITRIATAVTQGQMAVKDVDGIPVFACVVPAWWLSRTDVYEITVFVLGRPDRRYSLTLVGPTGQRVPLPVQAEETRVYPLTEGPWRHFYKAYVDGRGAAVSEAEVIKELGGNSRPMDTSELRRRWDTMGQQMGQWSLACGDDVIRVMPVPEPRWIGDQ